MQTAARVAICGAKRTPFGALNGTLKDVTSAKLGAAAAKAALGNIQLNKIDSVICGNTWPLATNTVAGLITQDCGILRVPTYTVNRLEGSGLQALASGYQEIASKKRQAMLCVATENMSQAQDKFLMDYWMAARFATEVHQLTRAECDNIALESRERWKNARDQGWFRQELVPLAESGGDSDEVVLHTLDKLGKAPHIITDDKNVITQLNSAAAGDGAAAMVLANADYVKANKWQTLGYIHSFQSAGTSSGPYGAIHSINNVVQRANLRMAQIGLFEIHEQYACVLAANIKSANMVLDAKRVNANGGAIAMGNPIAASGMRMVVHLVHELTRRKIKYGVAAANIGAGEGIAILVEMAQGATDGFS